MLEDHAGASQSNDGHLLTGPMFSHLVGNLLLRHVDQVMAKLPVRYFRYVDDITLVGSRADLDRAVSLLKLHLDKLDLAMHGPESPKSLAVSAKTWLQGEHDFAESKQGVTWMTLVGDLKRLLVLRPELRSLLVEEFASNGIRMPVPDYSAATAERGYRVRLAELLRAPWFRRVFRPPSVQDLVRQALTLRRQYHDEAIDLLESINSADAFVIKRVLPKLRYRFGRLAYVGQPAQLAALGAAADRIPALRFQGAVAKSIAHGDLSEVIAYGVNAAQAAAQPLRMQSAAISIGDPRSVRGAEQALAVLKMNGLCVESKGSINVEDELLRLAADGSDHALMRSTDPYIREVACLHGVTGGPRHAHILSTAFDRAEEITLDAIEQEHQTS